MENNSVEALSGSFAKLHSHPVIGALVVVPWEREKTSNYVITESFIRWLQGAGARVVPIIPGKSEEHYRDVFDRVNGLFIPGGADYPMGTQKPVSDVVELFLRWSKESLDEKRDYFPIWGTCLGLQALLCLNVIENHGVEPASNLMVDTIMKDKPFDAVMGSFKAHFTEGAREKSVMLKSLSDEVYKLASTLPIHPYLHKKAVTVADFNKYNMGNFYHLLGSRADDNGLEYVTYMEAKSYPIYATMIHYEKVCFQWTQKWYSVDKSIEAIRVSQAFANFFAQECCKNDHKFETKEEEWKMLIENYAPQFVAPKGHILDSIYTFD